MQERKKQMYNILKRASFPCHCRHTERSKQKTSNLCHSKVIFTLLVNVVAVLVLYSMQTNNRKRIYG